LAVFESMVVVEDCTMVVAPEPSVAVCETVTWTSTEEVEAVPPGSRPQAILKVKVSGLRLR
jgi:hypothetical protein